MSIASVCDQMVASIRRARSLFGAERVASRPESIVGALNDAVCDNSGSTPLTDHLSGALVDRHRLFATSAAAALAASADTDTVLASQLTQAAAVSRVGAARLNVLFVQAWNTSSATRTAQTPTAQSALLDALRSQVAQTYEVVSSTQQQVSQITRRTRSLDYPFDLQSKDVDAAQPISFGIGAGGLPGSPILVWCVPVRGGGIGFVCSKHYGSKTTEVYRAPYDESGVLS